MLITYGYHATEAPQKLLQSPEGRWPRQQQEQQAFAARRPLGYAPLGASDPSETQGPAWSATKPATVRAG